jgi:hypothetical protein
MGRARQSDYEGLSPSFARLCRAADKQQRRKPIDARIARACRLLADDIPFEQAWYELKVMARRSQAAASTVEALVYQLRQGGVALSDLNAKRRLAELSEQQLHEVSMRLQRFMPHIARAWTPSEIELLVQIWSNLHG